MKILAVLANDKKDCLDRFLCNRMVEFLKARGHSVEMLDLYTRAQEIPFYIQQDDEQSTTHKGLKAYPFFHESKHMFLDADMLIVCCPMYCFSMPSILKNWFELLTPVACVGSRSSWPKPLHHIKQTFVVATMGMPWIFKILFTRNCFKRTFKSLFSYIGIKYNTIHEITSVESVNPDNVEQEVQKIFKKLTPLC
jgi:putative NADPH-quinone reductase